MVELLTSIDIDATSARVWGVLTAFDLYHEWNPYISRLEGELAPGGRLEVTTPPPAPFAPPRVFRPVVLDVDAGVRFSWVGVLVSPAIFRGEHYFHVESLGRRRTRLVHGERFSGLIRPLHRVSRYYATKRGFERMNAALKRRAESLEAAA